MGDYHMTIWYMVCTIYFKQYMVCYTFFLVHILEMHSKYLVT